MAVVKENSVSQVCHRSGNAQGKKIFKSRKFILSQEKLTFCRKVREN